MVIMILLAAGLYVGPFVAGLSDQPGETVLVFGACLAVWSFLYQSGSWPRYAAELANPAYVARAALRVCVMLVLAGLFFLAGTGLSYITGSLAMPLAVPVVIPVCALILAVIVQSPRKVAELDAFLDDALRQLQGMEASPVYSQHGVMAAQLANRMVALPADAEPDDVLALLRDADELDAALLAAIDRIGAPPPRPARLAAVLLVTDRERGPALAGRGEAAWVFDLARGDPQLESLFARRSIALLSDAPHMWRDMPYSYDVDQACEASSDPDSAALLASLRERLNEISAQEESSQAPLPPTGSN